jgi:hypothetical protein
VRRSVPAPSSTSSKLPIGVFPTNWCRVAPSHGTGRDHPADVFSADETTDIGYESGTAVSPDYTPATNRFTGKINWVQIDLGNDDHDHFIDPDERLRIDMARQ